MSVLDGWWIEGYNGANGWAFNGSGNGSHDRITRAENSYAIGGRIPHAWLIREAGITKKMK